MSCVAVVCVNEAMDLVIVPEEEDLQHSQVLRRATSHRLGQDQT